MIKKLSEIFQEYKRKKKWRQAFAILATLVVLITGYTLILPAITMEKKSAIEDQIVPMEASETEKEPAKDSESLDEKIKDGQTVPVKEELLLDKEQGKVKETKKTSEKKQEEKEKEINKEETQKEDTIDDKKNGEEEKEVKEEKEEKEEKKTEKTGINTFDFKDNKNGIKGRVKIKNGDLPEGSILKVEPIKKEKKTKNKILRLFSLSKTLDEKDSKEEELEKKTEKIEESIEGNIEEILFYDISFFTPEGEYLPVGEKAKITFDLSGENMSKREDETISVGHFKGDQLELLDAKVQVDKDKKVEEISFDTEGFSVFAVIKHGTWTEARIESGAYTIITPVDIQNSDTNYQSLFVDTDGNIRSEKLDTQYVAPTTEAEEIPYKFKNTKASENYSKFYIEPLAGNRYTIRDIETEKYLAIKGEELVLNNSTTPYYFKIYKNSQKKDSIRIQAASVKAESGKDEIPARSIAFDPSSGKYQVETGYQTEGLQSYHRLIRYDPVYRILSHEEIKDIDDGKYIIVDATDRRKGPDRRSLLNEYYNDTKELDSTSLRKDGDKLYVQKDPDSDRNGIYRLPVEWTIKENGTNKKNVTIFNIKDDKGQYLQIGESIGAQLNLITNPQNLDDNRLSLQFEETKQDSVVQILTSDGNWGLNLKGEKTTWYTYYDFGGTGNNNAVYIAKEIDTDPFEDDLVEAIIPDGMYFITNQEGDKTMLNDKKDGSLGSDSSSFSGDLLTKINEKNTRWEFERQADGTYRIYSDRDNNRYKLRLGNSDSQEDEFNKLVVGLDSDWKERAQKDGQEIRIMTLKSDPTAFFIYSKYGSLQMYNNTRWASKPGSLGDPLRLFDADKKLFTHQFQSYDPNDPEKEYQKLADIEDGDYIIGNAPNIPNIENNTNNKIEFKTLEITGKGLGVDSKTAWLNINEKWSNDNNEYHTVESVGNNSYSQWKLVQTDQPGHYYIKINGNNLALGPENISAVGTNDKPVSIYRSVEFPDQVLITQGNYRLRFDGTKWEAVENSVPIDEKKDYHYLAKSPELSFKLTNPEEGVRNNWLPGGSNGDQPVAVKEDMSLNELGNKLGNIPKGSHQEGPIAKAYEDKYLGNTNNPYTGLYHMSQEKDKNFDSLPKEVEDEHYKEYEFIGWSVQVGEQTYVIKKDASFKEQINEGTGQIELVFENQEDIEGGLSGQTSLTVPIIEGTVFKTEWKELSAPLYFVFNYGAGIMDVERMIKTSEILEREDKYPTIITPIMASGRLFFGEDISTDGEDISTDGEVNNSLGYSKNQSTISMDNEIQKNYRVTRTLAFDRGQDSTQEGLENQIYFDRVNWVKDEDQIKNLEEFGFELSPASLKQEVIDWLGEKIEDYPVAIYKEPVSNREKDENEIKDDPIYYQPDPKDMTSDDYKIDFLDLEQGSSGAFLKGVVYAETKDLVIEKDFKNLEIERVLDLLGLSRNNGDNGYINDLKEENFTINIKTPDVQDSAADMSESSTKDRPIFELKADRYLIDSEGKPNYENNDRRYIYQEQIEPGEEGLSYWDIERVDLDLSKMQSENLDKIAKWTVRTFNNKDFSVEETNLKLARDSDYEEIEKEDGSTFWKLNDGVIDNDPYKEMDNFTRFEYYPKKNAKDKEDTTIDTMTHATNNKTTLKSGDNADLNTKDIERVRINNLYSDGGVILLTKTDEKERILRDIEFELYKKVENSSGEDTFGDYDITGKYVKATGGVDEENPTYVGETDVTTDNGTIVFKDLQPGEYVLEEVLNEEQKELFDPIEPFHFEMVEKTWDKSKDPSIQMVDPNDDSKEKAEKGEVPYWNGSDKPVNYIKVKNTKQKDVLVIEKEFIGLEEFEKDKIREGNFSIIIEGVKDDINYKSELKYNDRKSTDLSTTLVWYLKDIDGKNIYDMDSLTLEEKWTDGTEPNGLLKQEVTLIRPGQVEETINLASGENKYEVRDLKSGDQPNLEKIHIKNTYTDGFNLQMEIKGKDKNYKYKNIEGMEFTLYGSIDEAINSNETVGKNIITIDEDGKKVDYYKVASGTSDSLGVLEFTRQDENGKEVIADLSNAPGNVYYLVQTDNPYYQEPGKPPDGYTVYETIEEPFKIEVNAEKVPVVEENPIPNNSKTRYTGGTLYINLDLERDNYRLPETGGIGTQFINKVAVTITTLAATSLIYRKRKQIRIAKGERKYEKN